MIARHRVAWIAAVALFGCGDTAEPSRFDDAADAAADAVDGATDGATDGETDLGADTGDGSGSDVDGAADATPAALVADAGPGLRALVGEAVTLDGGASTGAVSYAWDIGDGAGLDTASPDPTRTVRYDQPGRYRAVLEVRDAQGRARTDGVTVTVTLPPVHTPRHSSTIARLDGADIFVVVSADSDEVVFVNRDGDQFARGRADRVCDHPRTVAPFPTGYVVACQDDDSVRFVLGTGTQRTYTFDWGARPFGVITDGDRAYVSLQGTGELAVLQVDAGGAITLEAVWPAIDDARGVALLPDGRVAVTRWRSPDERGEIAVVDPVDGAREVWTLAYDDQLASDTETGGVPTYLGQIVVSPDGGQAVVPSTQANIGQGLWVNGERLTHETTVRGILSWLDVTNATELRARRKQFDDRGLIAAATFSRFGDWLYVVDRGHRSVEVIDVFSGAQSGTLLDVGYAPEGLALTSDDAFLLVDATLAREVRVYDVRDGATQPVPVAALNIPTEEPLSAVVLRGKQLFNDAFDDRLSRDGYIACAHCHLDGESDRRTWDFTDRAEGLRNTISLLGRAGTGHGPIHWSANFDEVQDFEHDMRGPFGGRGLMDDASFASGGRDTTLGTSKAGVSADLDALAAYVSSLTTYPRSPHRAPDGSLTEAARRGRALFESTATGCTGCHSGDRLTDSQFVGPAEPLLHDVGTLRPSSGERLDGPLLGLDTPTLHELFNSAPYLHDGSAETLFDVLADRDALDAHGVVSTLDDSGRADLVAYLLSLDGRVD